MEHDIAQMRKALIKKAKKQVQEKYSEKDVHIIRAVSVLGDLDNAFNLLAEDCIEWYGAHFPEMNAIVKDNDAFLRIVKEIGDRKEISAKALSGPLGSEEKERAMAIEAKVKGSMGSPVPARALKEMQLLASNALVLKEERKELQVFIEEEMQKLAPNFSRLAGEVLGARLLASAGGLKQLALKPGSTMQLLGAEKALFRHLKNRNSKGPKYGFIYGHPMVKKALPKNKGRLARTLASKLVLAARADYFGSKRDVAKEMLASLEKRAKELE